MMKPWIQGVMLLIMVGSLAGAMYNRWQLGVVSVAGRFSSSASRGCWGLLRSWPSKASCRKALRARFSER